MGTLVLVGGQAEAKGKMVHSVFLGIYGGKIIPPIVEVIVGEKML